MIQCCTTSSKPLSAYRQERRRRFGRFVAGLLGQVRSGAARHRRFSREIEGLIAPMLASGVRVDAVARQLGCSRQTLYRRLKAEGSTFERLLDDVRRKRAIPLIRDKGASVKDVAYRLGYSDPAVLSRAYKRWTGHAPSESRSAKRDTRSPPPHTPSRPTAG